jgi:hypothetical protein
MAPWTFPAGFVYSKAGSVAVAAVIRTALRFLLGMFLPVVVLAFEIPR